VGLVLVELREGRAVGRPGFHSLHLVWILIFNSESDE
jgi:hypothetical protein